MADIEYVETLLPSGRGIRIERLRTKQYRDANKRATEAASGNVAAYGDALAHELLLTSLRALTPAPVPLVFEKDQEGNDTTEVDLDATLDAVPAAAWQPQSYQGLITAGATELNEVLGEIVDYTGAINFVQRAVMSGRSPLGLRLTAKMRSVGVTK